MEKERIRASRKAGVIATKMMSFKIDLELIEKLNKEVNKGRLINNLLYEYYSKKEEEKQ